MKYIGIVDWANEDKNGNKIAGVKPLYEVSDPKWKLANTDEFQPDGKIFWFKATAKQNDLIFFTAKESNKTEGYSHNLDRYESVREILDFRNLGTVDEVRKAMASGFHYSGNLSDKSYILCKGGLLAGPINISKTTDDLLHFEAAQIHRIPCYSIEHTSIREIQMDSETRHICLDQNSLIISSYVDWDSNRNVIKRAVEYAINNSNKSTENSINIKDLIAKTYEQLKEGNDSVELSLQINRLKRTVDIVKQVGISNDWSSELITHLMELPTIQKELNSIREKSRNETIEKIRTELNSELKGIEKIRTEKENLENDIKQNVNHLEKIKKDLESHTEDIEKEIQKRIETIINKPADFIAEAAFLKGILPHLSINQNSKPNNVNHTESNSEWNISSTKISTADELKRLIIKAFRRINVKSDVGISIHAALTAGIMPVLSGFNAGAAVDMYSRIACGGRLFRVSISPTSIDAIDLFGKYNDGNDAFSKQGSNLLDFVEIAKRNPEPAIIVFEGINKAPTESYLMPILEAVFFGKTIPLSFSGNETYNFEWTENLLPVATVIEGPTTLPLSIDVWSRSVLLDASCQYNGERYAAFSDAAFSEIDLSSELFELFEDTDFDMDDEIFEQFPEFKHFQSLTNRFINGLGHFYDLREENARTQVEKILIESLIFPLVALTYSDEEKDVAINRLTQLNIADFKDTQKVRSLINRIARKIA